MSTASETPRGNTPPRPRPLPILPLFFLSILAAMILGLLLGSMGEPDDDEAEPGPDAVRNETP